MENTKVQLNRPLWKLLANRAAAATHQEKASSPWSLSYLATYDALVLYDGKARHNLNMRCLKTKYSIHS